MIQPRPSLLLAALSALLLSACYSGPRKPLFGGGEDPAAQPRLGAALGKPQTADPAQALALKRAEVDELLARLRKAGVGGPKQAALAELLRRGPAAKPLIRAAVDEEQVVLDMLLELARRLDARPRRDRPGRVAARWVREKYRLALDRYEAGDLYGALRVIDAVFVLEPETDLAAELHRLRRRCTDRLMRDGLLRADIAFVGSGCLSTAERLKVTIRLTNVSRERIVLEVSEERGRALGVVSLDYEELSHTGTRTRLRTQHRVVAPRALMRLGPGQMLELGVELPSPHRKLTPGMVGRYHVSGWLRAQTMTVGKTSYPGFIPLLAQSRLALAPADLPLSRDPAARFGEQVAAAQRGTHRQRREPARRAFVAALAWAAHDREGAQTGLIQTLERVSRPPLSDALCAALGRVTGEPLSFSRHEWLMWWAERESRPARDDERGK